MPLDPIELICFDLGLVLIDICRDWDEACRLARVPPPPALGDPLVRQQLIALVDRHESGACDTDHFDRQTAQLSGLRVDQAAALNTVWLKTPYPGVDDLIDRVTRASVQTACLTNTVARHWQMMNSSTPSRLPLHRFDFRFASHELGLRKPSAAIYEHVEHVSGARPQAILFFDDRLENIAAAAERGWQATQIEDNGDPVTQLTEQLSGAGIL